MKPTQSIRAGLAAATAALIGAGSAHSIELPDVDSAVLYYADPERVSAVEGVAQARKSIGGERILVLKLVFDALTGASANGATPSNKAQTFTRPSGKGQYTVPPGVTPLDDTFHDTRVDGSINIEIPFRRHYTGVVGVHASTEFDYHSFSANATLSRDFNKRNTTASIGVSVGRDIVDPVGGRPIPFASMARPGPSQPKRSDSATKDVTDVMLGLTQVVDRSTLLQLNYSFGRLSGYNTDPYKLISVVDGPTGSNPGDPLDYIYEHRPNVRTKHSVYGSMKRHLGKGVADLSYRFLWDDWSIRSHTVEMRYRWEIGARQFLQPQLRYYHQSAADFYVHSLINNEALPAYASADYRLGKFDGYTIAVRYGIVFAERQGLNVRLGYYLQMGDSSPPDAVGSLKSLDLFPSVDAVITQIGYTWGW